MDNGDIIDQAQPPGSYFQRNDNKEPENRRYNLRSQNQKTSTKQSENSLNTNNNNPTATHSKSSKRGKRAPLDISTFNNGGGALSYSAVVTGRVTRQSTRNGAGQAVPCPTLPSAENIPERHDKQTQTDKQSDANQEKKQEEQSTPTADAVIPNAKQDEKGSGWTKVTKKKKKPKKKEICTDHVNTTIQSPSDVNQENNQDGPSISTADAVIPNANQDERDSGWTKVTKKKKKPKKKEICIDHVSTTIQSPIKKKRDIQKNKVKVSKQELKAEKLPMNKNNPAKTIVIDLESSKESENTQLKKQLVIKKNKSKVSKQELKAEKLPMTKKNSAKTIVIDLESPKEKENKKLKKKRDTQKNKVKVRKQELKAEKLPMTKNNPAKTIVINLESSKESENTQKKKGQLYEKITINTYTEGVPQEIAEEQVLSPSEYPDDYQQEQNKEKLGQQGDANETEERFIVVLRKSRTSSVREVNGQAVGKSAKPKKRINKQDTQTVLSVSDDDVVLLI